MEKNNKILNAVKILCMCLISLIFIIPLYFTVVNSFIPLYSRPGIFLPSEPFWENYKYAVTLIPFWRYLKNSIALTTITVVMSVTLNFIYAYAFARLKTRWGGWVFTLTLSLMMIPSFATQIPQYIITSKIGLKDTYWMLLLLWLPGNAHTIFLYRQYLKTFPKEIEEAAIIDGCGYFNIITRMYIPMCTAVIAIVFFNSFAAGWNDFMTPFMFFSSKNYPLALALFNSKYVLPNNPTQVLQGVVNAAALIFMIPVIIVFFFCQKQLVEGVVAGSVKG